MLNMGYSQVWKYILLLLVSILENLIHLTKFSTVIMEAVVF